MNGIQTIADKEKVDRIHLHTWTLDINWKKFVHPHCDIVCADRAILSKFQISFMHSIGQGKNHLRWNQQKKKMGLLNVICTQYFFFRFGLHDIVDLNTFEFRAKAENILKFKINGKPSCVCGIHQNTANTIRFNCELKRKKSKNKR